MELMTSVGVKELVIVMGLVTPLLTAGILLGGFKYLVMDLRRTVYGNGKPGLVREFNDLGAKLTSDIRDMQTRCDGRHAAILSESTAERKISEAAEVAITKLHHEADVASARIFAEVHHTP